MRKLDLRTSVLIGIILLVAVCYFFLRSYTLSPIGAIALFGGAYFSKKWQSLSMTLAVIILSDLAMQLFVWKGEWGFPFYFGSYFVYATFALIALMGRWMIKKASVLNIVLASAVAAIAHWIITDTGVWALGCTDPTTGVAYTLDWAGLVKCHVMALPYMRDFFMGTLIYSAILFGGFELAKRKFPVLSLKTH